MLTNQNRILIYSFIEILITMGWKDNPDTCGGFKFSSQYPTFCCPPLDSGGTCPYTSTLPKKDIHIGILKDKNTSFKQKLRS